MMAHTSRFWCSALLLLLLVVSPPSAPGQTGCTGDCNQDGVVKINELILGVNIVLGLQSVNACPSLDVDLDGQVTINEFVLAVNKLINDACPIDLSITGGQAGGSTSVSLIFNGVGFDVYVIGFELCFDPEVFNVDSTSEACRADSDDATIQALTEPFSDGRPCLSVMITSNQGVPPDSDCCAEHGGSGCDDAVCEQCVCADNGQCCESGNSWTLACEASARSPLMGVQSCAVNCLCQANGPLVPSSFSLLTCTLNVFPEVEPGDYKVSTRTTFKGDGQKTLAVARGTIEVFAD